ncbi:MAG: OmpA family protein [Verrucomicrobiae bacterium]|nr:OmpA family protein [Verrucomicrobiae bacterium]
MKWCTLRDGLTVERPYVPLPFLFVVGQDSLRDASSRRNVKEMSSILKGLKSRDGQVRFEIQGHISAEGETKANRTLSENRASRIRSLLLPRGVEARILNPVGLGEGAAQHGKNAPEAERQLDRRVLIVRTK